MPAGAASRYALGAHGVGAVCPAPAASLISKSRYALGARHSARRGRAARLCVPRGAQPLAAIGALRYALGADGVGAARLGACALWQPGRRLELRARRRRHGRCAPGRLHVFPPPDNLRALPLSDGDVEDVVRFALLGRYHHARSHHARHQRAWSQRAEQLKTPQNACGAAVRELSSGVQSLAPAAWQMTSASVKHLSKNPPLRLALSPHPQAGRHRGC